MKPPPGPEPRPPPGYKKRDRERQKEGGGIRGVSRQSFVQNDIDRQLSLSFWKFDLPHQWHHCWLRPPYGRECHVGTCHTCPLRVRVGDPARAARVALCIGTQRYCNTSGCILQLEELQAKHNRVSHTPNERAPSAPCTAAPDSQLIIMMRTRRAHVYRLTCIRLLIIMSPHLMATKAVPIKR